MAKSIFREAWKVQRRTPRYGGLFGLTSTEPRPHSDVQRERAWGLNSFEALHSYFTLEDPKALRPMGCETRVAAEIPSQRPDHATIAVTGTIDRLDEQSHLESSGVESSGVESSRVEWSGVESSQRESSGVESSGVEPSQGRLVVIDYKTGKAPSMPQWREAAFFQLSVYGTPTCTCTCTPLPYVTLHEKANSPHLTLHEKADT